jgi:hypothetical protein
MKVNSPQYNPTWCNSIQVTPGNTPLTPPCATLYVGTAGNLEVTFIGDVDNRAIAQQTAVNATADTITIASHGFTTGQRVFVASNGTYPTGLATATAYWVIVVDANTIKLASSLVNALTPTPIDITGLGDGTKMDVFQSTTISSAPVGYHPLNVKRVSVAASTAASAIVGLY